MVPDGARGTDGEGTHLVLVTYRPGYRPAWMDRSYVRRWPSRPLTSQDSLRVVQAVLPTAALTAPAVCFSSQQKPGGILLS